MTGSKLEELIPMLEERTERKKQAELMKTRREEARTVHTSVPSWFEDERICFSCDTGSSFESDLKKRTRFNEQDENSKGE
jgi:hypothetical protein